MIAYGNRWKNSLGKTLEEFFNDPYWSTERGAASLSNSKAHMMLEYNPDGTAKKWTYYSAGGGLMRLYATEKMAKSRNPKGEVFAVAVPE